MTPLEELAAAIDPYRLPAELERFWQREELPHFYPEPAGPSLALMLYRENVAAFPHCGPPNLLPVAYESHVFLSIDLETGEMWRWALDEDAYELVYPSFAALLDAATRGESEPGAPLRRIGCQVDAWPAPWLAAAGIDLRDREPRGATHTIAALNATGPGAVPATVRIAGEVVRLAGVGRDYYAVVDDGTGTLEVRCPAGVSPSTLVHRRRFELDVTVDENGATATAVRPLDC